MKLRLPLYLIALACAAGPVHAVNYLSGYSGGSSGLNSSVENNFNNGGSNFEGGSFRTGGTGRVAVSTSCCSIDAPHRAGHQQRINARKAAAERQANLPAPCGNYYRAPRACKTGNRK